MCILLINHAADARLEAFNANTLVMIHLDLHPKANIQKNDEDPRNRRLEVVHDSFPFVIRL